VLRDPVQIQRGAQALPQVAAAAGVKGAAWLVAVVEAVAGQDLGEQLPLVPGLKKTELATQEQSPLAQDAGGDGGIVVGCQVEVVGNREIEPVG